MWLCCGLASVALSSGTHALLCQAVFKGHFVCLLFLLQVEEKPTIFAHAMQFNTAPQRH